MNTDGVVTYLARKAVSQAAPVDAISSLGISKVLKAEKAIEVRISHLLCLRGSSEGVLRPK